MPIYSEFRYAELFYTTQVGAIGSVGLAAEIDTAGGGLATYSEAKYAEVFYTAQEGGIRTGPLTRSRALGVGLAAEIDTAGGGLATYSEAKYAEVFYTAQEGGIRTGPLTWSRALGVGLAAEIDTAGGGLATYSEAKYAEVFYTAQEGGIRTGPLTWSRALGVGLAPETSRATKLDSGLPPFWWRFYDQAIGKPSKRRLRPLVFTDQQDGQYYIIMRNEDDNLIRLDLFVPNPWDEIYPPYSGPTLENNGVLYRLNVRGGVLRFERSLFNVYTRPVLFGKVPRPKSRQPRYELVLRADD